MEGGCFKPKSEGDATVDPEADNEAVQAQIMALLQASQQLLQNLESLPEGEEGGEGAGDAGRGDAPPGDPKKSGGTGDGDGGPLSAEQEQLKAEIMEKVQSALGNAAADQVSVEKVRGGLRIQVTDQDGRPLFVLGGASLTDQGRALLNIVAQRLATVPNTISVEGHTDGLRMSGQKVTNWELSTARASAARIMLTQAGVDNSRLTAVTGYADTMPLPGTDRNDPQNRRISIMIWDEGHAPPPAAAAPPSAAPAQSQAAPADGGALTGARQPAPGRAVAPPPLPGPATSGQTQPPPAKTREQLEKELIESSMHRAATDRSSVGPPLPAQPDGEEDGH
jgi:flagellar motor protein MotB